MEIKFATFNIQTGIGANKLWKFPLLYWKYLLPYSCEKNIKKAAEILNEEKVDIAALNEVDGGCLRNEDQIEIISNNTNLYEKAFFQAYNLLGMVNQGNSIHSKYPIIDSNKMRLPGKGQPRYLGKATIKIDDKELAVFTTHLSLNKKNREKQIRNIYDIIKTEDKPFILSGDFNTENEGELGDFNYQSINHKTFPSWKPKKSLDKIFVSDHFRIIDSYTGRYSPSDHLPLIAKLELK